MRLVESIRRRCPGRFLPRIGAIHLLLFLASGPPIGALTLQYTERLGAEAVIHTFVITEELDGYSIVLNSRGGGKPETVQEFETDEWFDVLRWRYIDAAAGTDVSAVRMGEVISLSGRKKGKEIERTFQVGEQPWLQLFPIGLERFVIDRPAAVRFHAIGVQGIGSLRIGGFRANVGEIETVEWGGRPTEAVHVGISLSGIGSILWRGDYWHRPADGRCILSLGDRGPGSRKMRTELSAER